MLVHYTLDGYLYALNAYRVGRSFAHTKIEGHQKEEAYGTHELL